MGFIADIATRIRSTWAKDKEQALIQVAKGATASGMPMAGFDSVQAFGHEAVSDYLKLEHDLMSRYVDYEEMDDYPEAAAAYNIYADDATQLDGHRRKKVWVTSPDKEIEENLNYMLHKTIRIDEELWEMTRTLCKYGNDFEEILVTDEGVIGLNYLPPPSVRRIEGPRGELYGFIQDPRGRFNFSTGDFQQLLRARFGKAGNSNDKPTSVAATNPTDKASEKAVAFEGWEVVHFRLRGKYRRSVYGHGVGEPVRWIWRRLVMLEDSAMVYRLQRAAERFAFYVDVGDLPPQESLAWLNRVRQQFRKKKFVNAQGKIDLKMDYLSPDDDIYIPVRKGAEGTRVEVLGAPSWQSVEDIEYFLNKFFTGWVIPRAYIAQDDSTTRAVLSQQDVRFARTVLRVQGAVSDGVSKICRVHLMALGIDPAEVDYTVHLTIPSTIFELGQLEVMSSRVDLASRMGEFVSTRWILSEIFDLSDDEISVLMQEREEDQVRSMVSEARAQSAASAEFSGYQPGATAGNFAPQPGGGGGFGGDPGMDPNEDPGMGGMPEQPAEEPPPAPGVAENPGQAFPNTSSGESRRVPRQNMLSSKFRPQDKKRELREQADARERDKRLHAKLDQIRSSDKAFDKRLTELSLLLKDMRLSQRDRYPRTRES